MHQRQLSIYRWANIKQDQGKPCTIWCPHRGFFYVELEAYKVSCIHTMFGVLLCEQIM